MPLLRPKTFKINGTNTAVGANGGVVSVRKGRRSTFKGKIITKKYATINGIPELVRQLNEMAGQIDGNEALAALLEGATYLRDEARSTVVVGKNHDDRRQGIHVRAAIFASEGDQSKYKNGPSAIAGVSGRPLLPHNRAVLLERGTSKTPAQPFWRPSLLAARGQIASIIAARLRTILAGAGVK